MFAAYPDGQEENPTEVVGYNLRKGKITTHFTFDQGLVNSITLYDPNS